MKTRIALIHAVTVAIAPVQEAFGQLWPEAECVNILDDSLSLDRERDGVLTEAVARRISALARLPRPCRQQHELRGRKWAHREYHEPAHRQV